MQQPQREWFLNSASQLAPSSRVRTWIFPDGILTNVDAIVYGKELLKSLLQALLCCKTIHALSDSKLFDFP